MRNAHLSALTGELVRSIGILYHYCVQEYVVIIEYLDDSIAQNSSAEVLASGLSEPLLEFP